MYLFRPETYDLTPKNAGTELMVERQDGVKVTGSGRVKRSKAGGNHGLQEKSRKRLRRLRNNDMVDKTLEKKISQLLPYG